MALPEVEAVLSRQVVYDGEDYTREGLESVVQGHTQRQQHSVKNLDELSKAHADLSKEMSADLTDQKSAWQYVADIFAQHGDVGENLKGLLERIPVLSALVPDRPLHVLLTEKVEVAQRRTREVGRYLDRVQGEVQRLQADVGKLQKKMVLAARNEEAAALHVLELKRALEKAEAAFAALDEKSVEARELQVTVDSLKHQIWEHGAKLRLYSTAEDRLAGLIKMDNNFLEILRNLHSNMGSLYEAGNEVLTELQGNLAALASSAKASELSLDMQKAMTSLRTSVNRVAVLASETSLYLTQNVDRMTREMKVYDEATERLVEDNLRAEREVREERINETIALAEKELQACHEAKSSS